MLLYVKREGEYLQHVIREDGPAGAALCGAVGVWRPAGDVPGRFSQVHCRACLRVLASTVAPALA
jgi:hypothetical protein